MENEQQGKCLGLLLDLLSGDFVTVIKKPVGDFRGWRRDRTHGPGGLEEEMLG